MRIALISDIHGNLVALQTVLADIASQSVDRYVCLGDVAANGPQPHEVIELVRELGCPVVRGNTDEWFLAPQTYDPNSEKERRLMAMLDWDMKQFSVDDIAFMQSFQPRVEIDLENSSTLLAFHGSPQSNRDTILATTPDADLLQMLAAYRATVMAGGHTHTQMFRRYRDLAIINPGSVGVPIERGATPELDRRPSWSEYAIVDSHGASLAVELRRVPFDVDELLQIARSRRMPFVEAWTADWMKNNPPINP
jgi:putative phosphoesterase